MLNWLASVSFQSKSQFQELSEPPRGLQGILCKDVMGISTLRIVLVLSCFCLFFRLRPLFFIEKKVQHYILCRSLSTILYVYVFIYVTIIIDIKYWASHTLRNDKNLTFTSLLHDKKTKSLLISQHEILLDYVTFLYQLFFYCYFHDVIFCKLCSNITSLQ